MAFRSTAVRSIDLSIRLAKGLFDMKPEVEEYVRRSVSKTIKTDHSSAFGEDDIVIASVVTGPHKGGAPDSNSRPDYKLHSTVRLAIKNSKGEEQHVKTIHAYHDEEEYQQALQKVKELNRKYREEAK